MTMKPHYRLFEGLSEDDIGTMIAVCDHRLLVAGEELFFEGDIGGDIWIVKSGRAEIYTRLQGDVDRVLEALTPGDTIGEVTFIEPAARSASARTTETSEFLVLSREAFSKVERERPAVAAVFFQNIARIVAGRLRSTTELYRDSVEFNLESAGGAALNLRALSEELRAVIIHFANGSSVEGRLLLVDKHAAGFSLILKGKDGKMRMIPYHSVLWMEPTGT